MLLFPALFGACARQGTLTGGQKDTTPPVMDTLRSSPNYVTNFDRKKIELTFNEWVVLKDVTKEVVISPPIDPNPKISLKKKTVIVDLGDNPALRPNTTYTINFGAAVKDLHASNAAKDLRYVFATGSAIDSMVVEGIVLDALTGEPLENITVLLYDNLSDSAVIKEKKPYYFAKTAKAGEFSIKNVKPGQFKAVAVDEGQLGNLRWDRPETERIGFPDSLILLTDSMQRKAMVISVFKNQGPLRKISANADRYGVVRVQYSDKPSDILVKTSVDTVPGFKKIVEFTKDSMLVWYDFPPETTAAPWVLIAGEKDSIRVKTLQRSTFLDRHRLRPDEGGGVPGGGRGGAPVRAGQPQPPKALPIKTLPQLPAKPFLLQLNTPVTGFDTSRWIVTVDSVNFRNFSVTPDSISPRVLAFRGQWRPDMAMKLTLLPGAVTSYYGAANVDTFQYLLNIMSEKQLGVLNLTVEKTSPGQSYILEIMNGSAKELERRFTASETSVKFQFKDLVPATYTARIVVDGNSNGRWDTGSYFDERQPEVIITKKLDALRANWELEATVAAEKSNGKRN